MLANSSREPTKAGKQPTHRSESDSWNEVGRDVVRPPARRWHGIRPRQDPTCRIEAINQNVGLCPRTTGSAPVPLDKRESFRLYRLDRRSRFHPGSIRHILRGSLDHHGRRQLGTWKGPSKRIAGPCSVAILLILPVRALWLKKLSKLTGLVDCYSRQSIGDTFAWLEVEVAK